LSGVLTQHLGWRSIFFLSAFLGLVVTGVVLWKLRGEWSGAKGEKVDFAGSAIFSFALAALIYGLSLLPAMSGVWLIVGGTIGLSVFIRWEMRTRSPVLNLNLFRNNRAFTFSILVLLVTHTATFAVPFLISLYLQYLKGFSPQTAGLILVATPVMQAIFSPLAGRLSDRFEPRIIVSTGLALITAGLIVFIFLHEQTPLESIIGILILIGFGHSLFAAPNLKAAMTAAPKTASGVASAIVGTARTLGFAFSMGVAMLMFALYMGRVEITPEYYPLLQESMRMSFITFAVLCFGGIFASLARGKVR
jgi:MFS family permease